MIHMANILMFLNVDLISSLMISLLTSFEKAKTLLWNLKSFILWFSKTVLIEKYVDECVGIFHTLDFISNRDTL